MILYWILFTILGFLLVAVVAPVKIHFMTVPAMSLRVSWFFLRYRAVYTESGTETELRLFLKRVRPKKRPSAPKKEQKQTKPAPSKEKKKRKKITFSMLLEVYHHQSVDKIKRLLIKLVFRIYRSVRISKLKVDFGLDDFFLQGVLSGLTTLVPESGKIQVQGNFEERNCCDIIVRISTWKVLTAIALFLFCFPYINCFRLLRNFR